MTNLEGLSITLTPYGFIPGYGLYFLFVFLPGIGVGELLGIFKNVDILSEKFALAFGLGLSIDSLIMLVRTSGFIGLIGIDLTTVYFVIVLGIVTILASIALRKKLTFIVRPTGVDLVLFLLMLAMGGILTLYFGKFPIFPQSFSQDFPNHVNYVLGLISGSITSIPEGVLYFGVHYQFAAAYLLVGGEALITLQRTMGLLMVVSPLLFYYVGKKLFADSTVAGLISAVVYVLSGTIWYTGPIDAGLYPNFFGFLATLFFLVSLILVSRNLRSVAYWILFILALIDGYMSHYTFVTLLPAILILPLLEYITSAIKGRSAAKKTRPAMPPSLIPALVSIAPLVVPFLVYPKIGSYALYLASHGGGTITGQTYLSNAMSSIPFLHFIAVEVADDFELVALSSLALFCTYRALATGKPFVIALVAWFLTVGLTSPADTSAWRFSYEAVVPLTLMGCYGLYELGMRIGSGSNASTSMAARLKKRGSEPNEFRAFAIVLIGLLILIIGSVGAQTIVGSLSATSTVSQSQYNVYNAIYWLKTNTPNNSQYLSVSDYRFTYTSIMIGRSTYYSLISIPSEAISVAKNISAQYIIVTKLTTAQLPNVQNLYAWNNFPATSNANLTLLPYTNPDVRIYQIVSG